MDLNKHKNNIKQLISVDKELKTTLNTICSYLKTNIKHYDWVGFYFKNGTKNELKLMSFAGKPTEHTIIPFGKGICGQVAINNETFLVADVTAQDNYISCGIEVKSEIVVPVFKNDENIGQIDIDSHTINAFSKKDEEFLGFVCQQISEILTKK